MSYIKIAIGFLVIQRTFGLFFVASAFMVSVFSFAILGLGCLPPWSQGHFPQRFSSIHPSLEEITFISAPRPNLKPEAYNRVKLAISSWLSISPRSNVLLFVNRTSFKVLAEELERLHGPGRLMYGAPIKQDMADTPYIDDLFRQGIQRSPSTYVCFINADILISAHWFARVQQVFHLMVDRPILVIGQRVDFDLDPARLHNFSFTRSLLHKIDILVNSSRHVKHSPDGIDSFTFRTDYLPFEPGLIPPFLMGRYWWDNWIVGYANTVCDTITFLSTPPIYHINHKPHKFDTKVHRVAVNYYTRIANKDFFGSNLDTTWEISNMVLFRSHDSFQILLDLDQTRALGGVWLSVCT
jgi:hypothetical protein